VSTAFQFDLTADDSVAAALQRLRTAYGNRIASVIHLAAYFDLTGEPDPKYQEVTVKGTERLLRGFQEFGLEQFVFVLHFSRNFISHHCFKVFVPRKRGVS